MRPLSLVLNAKRTLLGGVLLALALPGMPADQPSYCDPDVRQPAGDDAYRMRGDRCEGIYVRLISVGEELLIASFTESFQDYDLGSGKDLVIDWTAPGEASVRLRAYPLRDRLYYRMDTTRPAGVRSYVWPSSLLNQLRILRRDIGVVGWTLQSIGNTKREVYLPLRIRQQGSQPSARNYQVVVLPDLRLAEVFLTLARVGEDGHPDLYIKKDFPLGYGYYPAGREIVIPIPKLPAPGTYSIDIGATLDNGGATTKGFLFYYAGE